MANVDPGNGEKGKDRGEGKEAPGRRLPRPRGPPAGPDGGLPPPGGLGGQQLHGKVRLEAGRDHSPPQGRRGGAAARVFLLQRETGRRALQGWVSKDQPTFPDQLYFSLSQFVRRNWLTCGSTFRYKSGMLTELFQAKSV